MGCSVIFVLLLFQFMYICKFNDGNCLVPDIYRSKNTLFRKRLDSCTA